MLFKPPATITEALSGVVSETLADIGDYAQACRTAESSGGAVGDSNVTSQSLMIQANLLMMGLRQLQCVPVTHCNDAWGVVIAHQHGWSVGESASHAHPPQMAVP